MLETNRFRTDTFLRVLGWVFLCAMPLWIFARSEQLRQLTSRDFLTAVEAFLLALSPFCTAMVFIGYLAPQTLRPSRPVENRTWARTQFLCVAAATVGLIAQIAYLGLTTPLDWDELSIGSALVAAPFERIVHLFSGGILGTTTTLHPLAVVGQWLTLKLPMPGWMAVRVPSILAAVATSILIATHVHKRFGFGTSLVLLGALIANRCWIHYGYSARGYSGAILFSTLTYLAVRRLAAGGTISWQTVLSVTLVLCFTTVHGAIFGVFCAMALLWSGLRDRNARTPQQIQIAVAMGTVCVAAVFTYKFFWIGTPSATPSTPASLWESAGYLTGVSTAWAARITSLFCFIFIGSRLRREKAGFDDLFFIVSIVALGAAFLVKTDGWQDRYLLPILFPWLLCLGDSIQWLMRRTQTLIPLAVAALLLIAMPASFRNVVGDSIQHRWKNFHEFTIEADGMVPDGEPLEALGGMHQMKWATKLYLRRPDLTPALAKECRPRYFLHFGVHRRFLSDPQVQRLLTRQSYSLLLRKPMQCL